MGWHGARHECFRTNEPGVQATIKSEWIASVPLIWRELHSAEILVQPAVKIRFQMCWVSIENLLGVKAGGMHFSCVLAGVPPENDNQNNYTQQSGQKLHQPQVYPQALTNL